MNVSEQGEKLGIQAAVAELHDPAQAPGVKAEQLALLPDEENTISGGKNHAEQNVLPRGAGRPPGSKNRSTEEWKRYLLNRGGSPLVHLQDASNATVQEFAEMIGWPAGLELSFDKALEIVKLQLACAKDLAPYVHQKQPMAIDNKGSPLMSLVIGSLPDQKETNHDGFDSMTMLDITPTENQGVSEENGPNSNETDSNENAVIEENQHAASFDARDLESLTKDETCSKN